MSASAPTVEEINHALLEGSLMLTQSGLPCIAPLPERHIQRRQAAQTERQNLLRQLQIQQVRWELEQLRWEIARTSVIPIPESKSSDFSNAVFIVSGIVLVVAVLIMVIL